MNASGLTRAALLTPLAPGAIAVIRTAGPRTDTICSAMLWRIHDARSPQRGDRRPQLVRIVERGVPMAEAVAVQIGGGDEAFAELNTHGGVRIVQRVLLLLERHGARVVPAEDMISAWPACDPVRRDVDRMLLHTSSRRLTRWLLAQRILLPLYLDRRCSLAPSEVAAFRRRSEVAGRLMAGLRIAIIGPPNAGKSTLANRLIGRDRVIASDAPGTTRDWISETALIRGGPVTLTDTAGIRATECSVEAEAVRRGREQAVLADLTVVLLDGTVSADASSRWLGSAPAKALLDRPCIVAVNKTDVMNEPCGTVADPRSAIRISALTGDGIDTLEARLEAALGLDLLDPSLPPAFLPHPPPVP